MIAESILLKALNNPEAIPDWLEKLENYAINLPPQGRVIYINRLVKGKDSRKTTLAGALSQIMVQKDIASKIIEDDFNLIIISEDFSEESIVPQIKQALNAFDNLGYI